MEKETRHLFFLFLVAGFLLLSVILGAAYGWPRYVVYRERLIGEAELARSVAAKQVAIQDALSKLESARHLSEADVIRAEGVAKSNTIIGNSLSGNEAYLKWLWIEAIKDGNAERIYIPTEAGMPILEASHGQASKN